MGGLAATASGLQAAQSSLLVWSHDLANANAPGFTPETPLTVAGASVAPVVGPAGGNIGSGSYVASVGQWGTGAITETSISTDLALRSSGAFLVGVGGTKLGFTRNGAFQWRNGGLYTVTGLPVLSSQSQPIRVPIGTPLRNVAIDGHGGVTVNGTPTGQVLGIVYPNLSVATVGGPGGAILLPPGTPIGNAAPGDVVSGALNGSGVSMTTAMMGLLSAEQVYVINTRTLDAQSQSLQTIAGL